MEVNLKIPSSLNEITLGQYQRFVQLGDMEDAQAQLKMIEIFCNVPPIVVRNMRATDIAEICDIINNLFDTKHQLLNRFTCKGVQYGFIPNLEDITFGEYVDLDTFIGDNLNLHRAVNVLYRPIEHRTGDRYTIKEYDPNTSELAKQFPLDAVLGAVVFFYNLGKELSTVILTSLDNKNQEILAEYLYSQESGAGTTASMQSLAEILQGLNISLN